MRAAPPPRPPRRPVPAAPEPKGLLRRRRVAEPEPGDETDEHSWISGFSARLHAYSQEEDAPEPSSNGEPDDAERPKAG